MAFDFLLDIVSIWHSGAFCGGDGLVENVRVPLCSAATTGVPASRILRRNLCRKLALPVVLKDTRKVENIVALDFFS